MLGDSSSSFLATTTTTSRGGDGGSGDNDEVVPVVLTGSGYHEEPAAGNSGEENRGGDRNFNGGNRWPKQETLALLKIRTDMDAAFRDASVKGPLWDEVSRKLSELGYNRSAQKCKEKFENMYKYHKRTKEGRSGKHEGKTYKFFDQLEAFESHPPSTPKPIASAPPAIPAANPNTSSNNLSSGAPITSAVPTPAPASVSTMATTPLPTSLSQGGIANLTTTTTTTTSSTPQNRQKINISSPFPTFSPDLISNSTSSSTSSDMEMQGRNRRKRKMKDLFDRLMREVVQKQEEMQRKFLDTIEKREHERMAREEAWKMQEMARINRERELLAQERSIAAAKDAALMGFLQKLSGQQSLGQIQVTLPPTLNQNPGQVDQSTPPPPSPPPQQHISTPAPTPQPVAAIQAPIQQEIVKFDNGNGDHQNLMASGSNPSSRWPKVEVHALIKLRTIMDSKYQENGPKGPLWEEISLEMRKLGYNRNAKRCKEKWENINKYFKKVKESNKKRPEDSKTCPYFHLLDALYKDKNKEVSVKAADNSVPLMVEPEQQWPPPPPPPHQQEHHRLNLGDLESDEQDDDDDDVIEEDMEDIEAGNYEFVSNKQPTTE